MILLFYFSFISAFAQTSYVPIGQVLKERKFEFQEVIRYWYSTGRLDQDGENTPFESGESFAVIENDLNLKYGVTKRFQASFLTTLRQNRANFLYGDRLQTDSSSGLQSAGLGVEYAFPRSRKVWQYTLHGHLKVMPYTDTHYNTFDEDVIYFGDPGIDLGAGFSVTRYLRRKNFLSTKLTYRQPGKGLSSEINYQFEGALKWKWIAILAGIEGIYSLKNDRYTNRPEDQRVYNTGGTNLYNSINREFYRPYVGSNVALGKYWRLELKLAMVSTGRSTDSGGMFTLMFARRNKDKELKEAPDIVPEKKPKHESKSYSLQFEVVQVSKDVKHVMINLEPDSKIIKGMEFSLFQTGLMGHEDLLAHAVVTQLNTKQAILRITARYVKKMEIKPGIFARGLFLENEELK